MDTHVSSYVEIEANKNGVNILRLRRGKVNALDVDFCDQIVENFRELRNTAKAVVLTAEGSVFSAGVDIPRVLEEDEGYTDQLLEALDRLCVELLTFDRPLVAAINGHAVAGGCVIACCADQRIMAVGTGKIGVPELRVGVPFPPAPLEVMRLAVPTQYQEEVIYLGGMYAAAAAKVRGLVNDVAERKSLLSQAVATAENMAALPHKAFSITKKLLREPVLERIRAGNAKYDSALREIWKTPETREAMRSYFANNFKPE